MFLDSYDLGHEYPEITWKMSFPNKSLAQQDKFFMLYAAIDAVPMWVSDKEHIIFPKDSTIDVELKYKG